MIPREERERFNRIADLFLETVEQSAEQREVFLEAACAGDDDLRQRVTSLLARHNKGSVLKESDAVIATAAEPYEGLDGQRIARYHVLAKVGEGGMSVVYRAEDTLLDRVVALKFLAPHLARNADAVAQFEREAKAAAALDHPNVCPIHEIDRDGERVFLVMTFQEGKTLADMLRNGPLELETALDIAAQTCRGLAAAHAKRIVHRDIKPANLMICEATGVERLVRILDFGIARPPKEDAGSVAMGTASYMAPEQIRDGKIDGRADLWALGVVLYRMIAGAVPFRGATRGELLTAIARREPEPLSTKREGVPAAVEAIVRKALRKNPDQRYQTADEFLADLERVHGSLRAARQETRRPQRKLRRTIWAAASAALLAAAFALVPDSVTRSGEEAKPIPFTSYLGSEDHAAISPDEKWIAFIWNGETASAQFDVYVQMIGSQSPVRLTRTPENEHSPAWSPDGKQIAFLRQLGGRRKVLLVPAQGGVERELAEIGGIDQMVPELDWNPGGEFLAAQAARGIVEISVRDSSIRQLSFPEEGAIDSYPRFDPSGRRLAFLRDRARGADSYEVMPLDGGTSRSLKIADDLFGDWSREFTWNSDGTALLYRGPTVGPGSPLLELQISGGAARSFEPLKEPVRSPDLRGALMAYARHELNTNIWALDLPLPLLSGGAAAPVRLIASSMRQDSPQFSADGKRIAFSSDRSGSREIWTSDRNGQSLTQVTKIGGRHAGSPRWSPDGHWIAFDATIGTDRSEIYIVSSSGGKPRQITHQEARLPSWSHDGNWIYFTSGRGGEHNVFKVPSEGGEIVQVTKERGWECYESPEGRYLYYSERRGQVHRLDLASGDDLVFPELTSAGRWRYWAPGRNGIFFVDSRPEGNWLQFLNVESRKITRIREVGKLLDGPAGLAISPDERTVLFAQRDKDDRDIMLASLK